MTAHRSLVRGLVKIASSAPPALPAAPGAVPHSAPGASSALQTARALNRFVGQAAIPATLGAAALIDDPIKREKAINALAGLAAVTAVPGALDIAARAIKGEVDPAEALADLTQNILPVLAYGLARGSV